MAGTDLITQIYQGLDSLKAWSIACVTVGTLSTILRVYVRRQMVHLFGLEDWLMVAAFTFFLVLIGVTFALIHLAYHVLGGQVEIMARFNLTCRAAYGFYVLGLLSVKLSLGCFFLRILRHQAIQVAIIYGLLCVTVITSAIYWGLATFTCAQFRDLSSVLGACEWQRTADISNTIFSVVNIIGSAVFAGMAVIALITSNLSKSTKLVASLLLVIGSLGSVASVVRLSIVLQKLDTIRVLPQYFIGGRWLLVEFTAGIVAANLALTRRFFQACWQGIRRLGQKQSKNQNDLEYARTKSQVLQGAENETLIWIEKNVVLSTYEPGSEATIVNTDATQVPEVQIEETDDSSDLELGDTASKETQ